MTINRRTALISGLAFTGTACSPQDTSQAATLRASQKTMTSTSMDMTAQIQAVRSKSVKPSELVEDAIKRIERLNPQLNAVVTPCFERARDRLADLAKNKVTGGYRY